MNKTDTLMWIMRAHEAIRRLPSDAKVSDVDIRLYGDGNRINIFLSGETEIRNIVTKQVIRYKDCDHGRIEISDSFGVDYWWGVEFDDDGHVVS